MNKIYWLASYPKSGNTWVRVFLTNYLSDGEEPIDINHLRGGPIASDREIFDRWAGVEASDLSFEDIADLRPHVYRQMASHIAHPLYVKVHDACTRNSDSELLFPPDVTAAVAYLIRNPLDVAVSYSHHGGRDLEKVVETMCDPDGYVYENPSRLSPQLPQRLLSWSAHIASWVDDSGFDVEVIRYEDILADPEGCFARLLRTLGLPLDPEKLAKAVAFSRFDLLQEQETSAGFKERPLRADAPFFREGRSGNWRKELPSQLAEKIIAAHAQVMSRFGYLNDSGEPVY